MSKQEIFASHDIIFDPKKGSKGKVFHPVLGWISLPLKDGNTKVGKQVKTWSMLPGTTLYKVELPNIGSYTLKGTCPCDCNGCYAKTGRYNCDNVILSNAINTWLAMNDLAWLKRCIIAQIESEKIEYVRIHAAGDFFNESYVALWHCIAKRCPNTIFWTYTKNKKAENAFDDLSNVNIVKSIIPGHGFNFGKCEYIINTYEALKASNENVYICRCGIDKSQHCSNCKGCSANKYVLFIEHSTDYKAEKDLFFDTVKKMIESQASAIR